MVFTETRRIIIIGLALLVAAALLASWAVRLSSGSWATADTVSASTAYAGLQPDNTVWG